MSASPAHDTLRAAGEVARALLARHLFLQAGRSDNSSRFAVGATEVARLLGATEPDQRVARAASADAVCARAWAAFRARLGPADPLATLATSLGLSDLDLQIIVALVVIEVEPEMERAYAFAWDDFTRKRPDVGFVSWLVGGDRDRDAVVRALQRDQPLRRHGVVVLSGDQAFVMRSVRLADRVVSHLLGHDVIDDTVASFCHVSRRPRRSDVVADAALLDRLTRVLSAPLPRVLLYGADGIGKALVVEAIATEAGRPALRVDLEAVLAERDRDRLGDRLAACGREAALRGALLIVELGPDADARVPRPVAERVGELLEGAPAPVVLCAAARPIWLLPHVPSMIELEMATPSYRQRLDLWRRVLPAGADDADIELVAGRYAFGGAAITRAARRAITSATLRDGDGRVDLDDLGEAARLMFSHRLGDVAQRIPAGFS